MTAFRFGHAVASTALAIGMASSPAHAQDMDPSMPMDMPMPASSSSPPARSGKKAKQAPSADRARSTPSATAPDHDIGKTSNAATTGPHGAAKAATMPGAGHGMEDMAMPSPVPPIAALPITPTDADRAAAFPPLSPHPMHDDDVHSFAILDRFETRGATLDWDGSSWIGTDLDRLWIRSEGHRANGRTEQADVEVLYGHSAATWWDIVAGMRHDVRPGSGQDFAALGLVGLAPGKFELRATAYVASAGQTSLRLEAQRDLLLTNRLILQPLVEANLFGRSDASRGIGSGLSTLEAGLRLRYEVTRAFAPYIGVVREQAFGRTADFREAEGEDAATTQLVAGLRFWF